MQFVNKHFRLALAFILVAGLTGCEQIVNKMAFHPDSKNVIPVDQLPRNVHEVFFETRDKIKLQGYYLPSKLSGRIAIYFHGNAGNIGHRIPDLLRINGFGIHVLGVSYRGYGKSAGKPSEAGIYTDGQAAFNFAVRELGFSEEQIIVFGRSIGTSVAIDLSRHKNIGGLILVSPLTSGAKQAKASGLGLIAFIAGNSFNNIGKIKSVRCPVLIIHGTKDKIIPFTMGEEIYQNARTPKKLVEIKGANHNNLSTRYAHKYWPPIKDFINR